MVLYPGSLGLTMILELYGIGCFTSVGLHHVQRTLSLFRWWWHYLVLVNRSNKVQVEIGLIVVLDVEISHFFFLALHLPSLPLLATAFMPKPYGFYSIHLAPLVTSFCVRSFL
jgi:hypothetical protein